MEPKFWTDRWRSGEIGFHKSDVNDLLVKHWPALEVAAGSDVFVPLCGKSVDMAWLAEQGHRVIGAELSELAVDSFFEERGLVPETAARGSITVKKAGPYEIWQGDIFELPASALQNVGAVYDRAALVALPPPMQPRYAAKLKESLPAAAPILLIGLSYPAGQISGPPFSVSLARVTDLYSRTHTIWLLESRDGLEQSQALKERGVTALEECVYVMRRK
jgi:thiopurine S-methyltransferase